MPSSCFLLICISEKPLWKKSSELAENLRGLLLQQNEDGVRREKRGATHRLGEALGRGIGATNGWDPPLPVVAPLGPLRRLLNPINPKTLRMTINFHRSSPEVAAILTIIREGPEALPGTLPEWRLIPEASPSTWPPSG